MSIAHPVSRHVLETQVLPEVLKPGRYLGLEHGAYRKPFEQAEVTMVAAFPDLYEIGFSNYGLKLLYTLVNNQTGMLCDRVYAPALDFKAKLAQAGLPLYAVESFRPVSQFDVVAFSLQYELNYTTILGMLESACMPFRSADRGEDMPLVIAGGPGSANPMPLAPFIDVFIIGDGEHVLLELLSVVKTAKKKQWPKQQLLQALASLPGLYIPGITPKASKRIVDIAQEPITLAPLVPIIGAVHDRVTVEARRGCDRMCRFCQPCFINLPVREQSIEVIKDQALKGLAETGYEECSLLSLSIADYAQLKPLVFQVAEAIKDHGASLSLPSQRADRFDVDVAHAVAQTRKSTLTFAPEAGTERLRNVINKNLSDAEILKAATSAYEAGWNKVKLYFIIGLPSETDEDLHGIVDIVQRMQQACRSIQRQPGQSFKKALEVNITLSNFVPKPHTPFQWFAQDTMAEMQRKISVVRQAVRATHLSGVKINHTDPELSKLEAVISKGDERLAGVIESAYRHGAYLDAWDETEPFKKWFAALEDHQIDPEAYTRDRCCDPDAPLPWDCIDVGLTKAWLKTEYQRSLEAASTVPCFEQCSTCGVCAAYSTQPSFDGKAYGAVKPPEAAVPVREQAKGTAKTYTVRFGYEKRGDFRFVSHLDWQRLLQRAFVMANVPIAYSEGFNPHPKFSFGSPPPLFTESHCEFLDVAFTEPVTAVLAQVNMHLPTGGKLISETPLVVPPNTKKPSIDTRVCGITYTARWVEMPVLSGALDQLGEALATPPCQSPPWGLTIKQQVLALQQSPAFWVLPEKQASTPTTDLPSSNLQLSQNFLTVLPPEQVAACRERSDFWFDLKPYLALDSNSNSQPNPQQISPTEVQFTYGFSNAPNARSPFQLKPHWVLSWLLPPAQYPHGFWQLSRRCLMTLP